MVLGIYLARADFERFDASAAIVRPGERSFPIINRSERALVVGDLPAAMERLPDPATASTPDWLATSRGYRARVFLLAGERAQAAREFSAMQAVLERSPLHPRVDGIPVYYGALYAAGEAFLELADAAWLSATVKSLRTDPMIATDWWFGSTGECAKRMHADLFRAAGALDEAETTYRAALAWCERERCPIEAGRCHAGLAEVATRRGQPADARAHLDHAAALFEQHGALLYLRQVAVSRAALPAARPRPRPAAADLPDGLSEREVEVLRLLAAGRSNPEIAATLVISVNTVYRHVAHIFDKTGATNRVEAAAFAQRHGLTEPA